MKLLVTELKTQDVFGDIGRVHQSHRPGIPAGHIMRVTHGGKSCLLVARGARANQRGSLSVDLKTRRELGIEKFGTMVELHLSRASRWEEIAWGWTASEPISRIAVRLGVVSVVLGAVGVLLGLWSVVLAILQPLQHS